MKRTKDTTAIEGRKPRLYTELAEWWPLMNALEEYAAEADWMQRTIVESAQRPVETLLELGSGGGHMASHLKRNFAMTLADLSEAMLGVSRALNPECEHVVGDMRTLRLGRDFDAVLIHDAVVYLTMPADLLQALTTAFVHCRSGGVAVVAPDFVRETFQPITSHGGHDGPDGRALRYLEWTSDPDPTDTTYRTDFAFLLREAGARIRTESDAHLCGLFPRRTWIELMEQVGFYAQMVVDDWHSEVLVGVRRAHQLPIGD